nr:MAG TPA: hypothetical protein [Caudoviricetes sp.]
MAGLHQLLPRVLLGGIQGTPPTCGAGGVLLRFGGSSTPEDLKDRPDLLWRGGVPTQYLIY